MKLQRTNVSALCAIFTGLSGAVAQQPNQLAPAASLSISAKTVGSSASALYYWVTSWGSYDRDFFARQDVQIEAHNLSNLPAKITVDFYFIGRPEHHPEPRILFSRRTFTIDVLPGYQKRVSLKSDVLRSSEQRYVALNEQYNSGYQIAGWFLQASVPNDRRVFASASSEPAWVERMDWFDSALAEFQRTSPHAKERIPPRAASTPVIRPLPPNGKTVQSATPDAAVPLQAISVVLLSDTTVPVQYGETVIRKGTRMSFVSRDASHVYVRYGSETIPLPIGATKIEEAAR
jgi:hypothetical protein